jgi:tetratricopeptide (TPR) repeat protein
MTEGVPLQHAATLSAALTGAADLLERGADSLDEQLLDLLEAAPGQPHALLMLVSSRRAAGDTDAARAILEVLAEAHPNLASVQYEYGILLASLKAHDEAIAALSQVVKVEPNHPSAWRTLGDQYAAVRKTAQAADAYIRHFRIATAELQMMEQAAANDEQLAPAEAMLREFLHINPTDIFATWLLAGVGIRLRQYEDAEGLLRQALNAAPTFTLARYMLAWALYQQGKEEQALEQLNIVLQQEPDNPDYLHLKALVLLMMGDTEPALAYYGRLTGEHPNKANYWAGYGHALKTVGQTEQAVGALRKATEVDPGLGESWWTLASLRTFRFSQQDVKIMRRELAKSGMQRDSRIQMLHALGKALEDEKSYEESFRKYAEAKALRGKAVPYNPEDNAAMRRRIKSVFTGEFLRSKKGAGVGANDPIFILGMPRSGSTLVEQILASHSQVEGTKELRLIHNVTGSLRERTGRSDLSYPEIVRNLEREQFAELAQTYLDKAQLYRKLDRPRFIDKTPNNLHYVGLIHLMFPRASIVDIRRHPLACGMANFRLYFPFGQNYTSDLGHIGQFYREYVDLMAHFDAVLPGRVRRVLYEDLVADPEPQVRALLDYCELPFEEGCLRFYETKRSVLTPSSEQVRQPIFKSGLEEWRGFEPWLGPLKQALGDVLDAYPSVPRNLTDLAA